jgi:hypothetical protein
MTFRTHNQEGLSGERDWPVAQANRMDRHSALRLAMTISSFAKARNT